MMAWIRFWITAIILLCAILAMISAVIGNFKFGFVMNRVHAAGINDTAGIFLTAASVMVGVGKPSLILKLILVLIFVWCTSPIATHFIGQIEYYMDDSLDEHMRREDENGDN